MKISINNYTFDKIAKTVTFTDYASTGIKLSSVLLVVNATANAVIYNAFDPTRGGNVSGNVLSLAYDTSAMNNTDALLIYYEDPLANQSVTLGTGISDLYDSIIANPKGTQYHNVTASGVILGSGGKLVSMYVNSTSGGTIRFWDNASGASGTKINDTITPAIGFHNLGNANAQAGIYAEITGTINVTVYTI